MEIVSKQRISVVAFLAVMAAPYEAVAQGAATALDAQIPLHIVVDSSGSMGGGASGGIRRSDAAAQMVYQELARSPAARPIALFAVGGDNDRKCAGVQQLVPAG